MSREVWKDVADFPMYQVSTHGRVRSKRKGHTNLKESGLIKLRIKKSKNDKRLCVRLWHEGVMKQRDVHVLVFETFNGPRRGKTIDHKDRNPMNNHIDNLRLATRGQQCANTERPTNHVTKTRGVHTTSNGKFCARIAHSGKSIWLGTFDSINEAAQAYNAKAAELFGSFAIES